MAYRSLDEKDPSRIELASKIVDGLHLTKDPKVQLSLVESVDVSSRLSEKYYKDLLEFALHGGNEQASNHILRNILDYTLPEVQRAVLTVNDLNSSTLNIFISKLPKITDIHESSLVQYLRWVSKNNGPDMKYRIQSINKTLATDEGFRKSLERVGFELTHLDDAVALLNQAERINIHPIEEIPSTQFDASGHFSSTKVRSDILSSVRKKLKISGVCPTN